MEVETDSISDLFMKKICLRFIFFLVFDSK